MAAKLKLAFYWGAACGGCEVAVLDLNEKLLDISAMAEILFWPIAVDAKYHEVEALPDGHIDVAFINGAVRNGDNLHLAKLLRQKSRVVVALGSCAHLGGVVGLANFHDRAAVFERVYADNAANPAETRPQTATQVAEGELALPEFYNTVYRLADVVAVDYAIAGCPPVPGTILAGVKLLAEAFATGVFPPPGTVIGNYGSTVCQTCNRVKADKRVKAFKRIAFAVPEQGVCLLEQGILCLGSATAAGCGARCLAANMPCRGCFGAPDDVADQGARFLSALASVVDANDAEEIDRILAGVDDPMGYACRFSLPASLLGRKVMKQRVTVQEVPNP